MELIIGFNGMVKRVQIFDSSFHNSILESCMASRIRAWRFKPILRREGDVTVFGEDPLSVFNLKNVIKAIGRGFSATDAFRLFSGDETLSIINIPEIVGEREKTIVRMKSRIIGSGGRSKEHIEYVTNTRIAVYGKTISILGKHDDVADAEGAINMLLGGATHKSAFGAIQKRKTLR